MQRFLAMTAVLTVLAVAPAHGQAIKTSGDLQKQCEAEQHGACIDFLRQAAARLAENDGLCLPEGYDPEQLREAFVAWAGENTDTAGLSANDGLLQALKDAFPCEE